MFQNPGNTDLIQQSDGNTHMDWPWVGKPGQCLIKELTLKVFCNAMNGGKGSVMHKGCHRVMSRLGMSVTQKNAWSDARLSLWQQRWGTTGGSDLTGHNWIPLRAGREASNFLERLGGLHEGVFMMTSPDEDTPDGKSTTELLFLKQSFRDY